MTETSSPIERHQVGRSAGSRVEDTATGSTSDAPDDRRAGADGGASAGNGKGSVGEAAIAGLTPLGSGLALPAKRRRQAIAEVLYRRLRKGGESFWTSVYPLYMRREITRADVRDIVQRGLEEARGNYRIVTRLFNIEPHEYKRFLNFLRKHECEVPFKDFR